MKECEMTNTNNGQQNSVEISDLTPTQIEQMKASALQELIARKEVSCPSCGSTNCSGEAFSDNAGVQLMCLDCSYPFYGEVNSINFSDIQMKKTTQ
jgi:tRNA(Ile2) C34 agmatinyltransferase TiaS